MPLLSFLDENRGNILVTLVFYLVNIFLFQFKVHHCSGFFFFKVRNTGEPSILAWIS